MIRKRSKLGRGGRRLVMLCESLEGRVVLSGFGSGLGIAQGPGLVGSLSSAGVIVGPIGALSVGIGFDLNHGLNSGTDANIAQFKTDVQKLRADLTGIAAKSGVTIADIINLVTDSRAIASAGAKLDQTALTKAVTDLANAVAGGGDTTAARAEFNALFIGTSILQATIDKTYADIVQTVIDSKVTPTDINTITADRIAIQTDLNNLHQGQAASTGTGSGSGSGSGTGTTKATHRTTHPRVPTVSRRGHR